MFYLSIKCVQANMCVCAHTHVHVQHMIRITHDAVSYACRQARTCMCNKPRAVPVHECACACAFSVLHSVWYPKMIHTEVVPHQSFQNVGSSSGPQSPPALADVAHSYEGPTDKGEQGRADKEEEGTA